MLLAENSYQIVRRPASSPAGQKTKIVIQSATRVAVTILKPFLSFDCYFSRTLRESQTEPANQQAGPEAGQWAGVLPCSLKLLSDRRLGPRRKANRSQDRDPEFQLFQA